MKNLKKIISEIIFSLILGTSVFAEISFGANLKGGTGVGAVRAGDFENAFGTTDSILNITFGFDLNAQFGFKIGTQDFFVRPEFSTTDLETASTSLTMTIPSVQVPIQIAA